MGKKSNRKNKPSKAEKRRQKAIPYALSFSEKHLDEMEDHFNEIASSFWDYVHDSLQVNNAGGLDDPEKELNLFNRVVALAAEAWNMAVTCGTLDNAIDTAYDTHPDEEAELISGMIKYKIDEYPQDKVLIKDTYVERDQNGEFQIGFRFDFTVMDDELDALEAKNNDFSWEDLLDQDAIDRALEGIPPEFKRAAYDHEVNRQINEMKKKLEDILKAEKLEGNSDEA